MPRFNFFVVGFLQINKDPTMLSDDIFYSRFCDLIVGAEEDPANEDMKALNVDGGIVVNSENKSQRIKFLMH